MMGETFLEYTGTEVFQNAIQCQENPCMNAMSIWQLSYKATTPAVAEESSKLMTTFMGRATDSLKH